MANVPVSDLVVKTFTKGLSTFDYLLTKAEEHAKEKGLDVDTFVQAQLVEDQLPFAFQVQNATKAALVAVGRFLGEEPAVPAYSEKTFAELHKRIADTLAFLKGVDVQKLDAGALKEATFPSLPPAAGKTYTATEALLNHSIPNFYFHLVTGYSILRAKGVSVGKVTYLTEFFTK